MKTNIKKLSFTLLLAASLVFSVLCTAVFSTAFADAETDGKVSVVDGASLRLESKADDLDFGMRFKLTVAKNYLQDTDEVHALLIPTRMLGGEELTKDTADVLDKKLDLETKYEVGDDYRFNVVLTDIPKDKYGTDITVRAAVVRDGDYIYSQDSITRSVAQVADGALQLDFDSYADNIGSYLVRGLVANDSMIAPGSSDSKVNAHLVYFDAASDEVKAKLAAKYPLTYESSETNVVSVSADGTLSGNSEGSATITVKCEALKLQETCTVKVDLPVYGQIFDFNDPDMSLVSKHSGHTTGQTDPYFKSDIQVTTLSDNKPALSVEAANVDGDVQASIDRETANEAAKQPDGPAVEYYGNQSYFGFVFAKPSNINNFTSITFTIYIDNLLGKADYLLFGSSSYVVSPKKEQTYTFTNSDTFWSNSYMIRNDGTIRIYVKFRQTYSSQAKLYITDIKFGFGFDTIDGSDTVNLYEKFGTDSANATFKFTPNGGSTAETIEHPEAFKNNVSGTITAEIGADGYKRGTWEVAYKVPPVYGQIFDFENPDMNSVSKYEKDGPYFKSDIEMSIINSKHALMIEAANVDGDVQASIDRETANEEAAKQQPDGPKAEYYGNQSFFGFVFDKPSNIDNFTSITFTIYIDNLLGKSTYMLFGSSSYVVSPKKEQTYTFTNSDTFWSNSYMIRNDGTICIYVKFRQTFSSQAKLYITDIKLGFGFDTIEGWDEVNLYDEFGTDEDHAKFEFTPSSGDKTEITDPEAFIRDEDGTITATIADDGYRPGTFEVAYKTASGIPYYGQLIDFGAIDETKLTRSNSTIDGSIKAVKKDGRNAIEFKANAKYPALLVTVPNGETMLDYSNKFDWLKVCYSVERTEGEGEIIGRVNTRSVGGEFTTSSGVSGMQEVIYNKDKFVAESKDLIQNKQYKFVCTITSTNLNTAFYIYSIQYGYNDISVTSDDNVLDLIEHFNLTAGEMQNVKFNDVAVQDSDLTAFTVTKDGTLTFTVKKAGYRPTTFSVGVNVA